MGNFKRDFVKSLLKVDMDKYLQTIEYAGCDYLSMAPAYVISVSKMVLCTVCDLTVGLWL